MKILSFGEIMWDVYPDKNCLGGAPLNFAAHVAKCNEQVYLLSAVGNDELGKLALQEIKKLNINDKYIKVVDDKVTGQCIVTLDENKVPKFKSLRDVSFDYLSLDEEMIEFDVVAFGSLPLRSENNVNLLNKIINNKKVKTVYCDLNLRVPFYNRKTVDYCLKVSNIIKISDTELLYIKDKILLSKNDDYNVLLKELANLYANLKVIILTCGENGSYTYKDSNIYYMPTKKVDVVSTVGAGDSYGATFLVNYLNNIDILTCMKLATLRSLQVICSIKSV